MILTNTQGTLRLAIIGGGVDSVVGYTHLVASQMDHRWRLVSACFSRKAERNEKTVRAWNLSGVRLYNNWRELLEKEKEAIDAVVILTPTPSHYEIVMAALESGIPTVCEKALASSYEEAEDISQTQKKYNGFLAVTHNYTGYPMLRELKQLVQKGNLGKVSQVQIEMPQEGFVRLNTEDQKPCPQAWRLIDGKIPGVSLDLGTHLQHMIHFVNQENPESLIADQNTFGWFSDIIDDVSVIARYPSGMKSVMWFGKSTLGHRNGLRIRVYGSQGSAEWYQMEPEILLFNDVHGNRSIIDRAGDVLIASAARYQRFKSGHPAGFVEAFANLYVDIADQLQFYFETGRYDEDWTYGAKQAAIGLKVFDVAGRSSKQKKWLSVF